jgi:hypothetical protein
MPNSNGREPKKRKVGGISRPPPQPKLNPKQIEQITKGAKRNQEPNFDECMGDIASTSTEDFDQDFFDAHESEIYKIVAQVVAAQIIKSYQ